MWLSPHRVTSHRGHQFTAQGTLEVRSWHSPSRACVTAAAPSNIMETRELAPDKRTYYKSNSMRILFNVILMWFRQTLLERRTFSAKRDQNHISCKVIIFRIFVAKYRGDRWDLWCSSSDKSSLAAKCFEAGWAEAKPHKSQGYNAVFGFAASAWHNGHTIGWSRGHRIHVHAVGHGRGMPQKHSFDLGMSGTEAEVQHCCTTPYYTTPSRLRIGMATTCCHEIIAYQIPQHSFVQFLAFVRVVLHDINSPKHFARARVWPKSV